MVKRIISIFIFILFMPGIYAMNFLEADAGYGGLSMKDYNASMSAYDRFNSVYGSSASINPVKQAGIFSLTLFEGGEAGPGMMFFYLRGSHTPFSGTRNVFYDSGGPMLSMKDDFFAFYFAPGLRYYFGKKSNVFTAIPFIGLDIGYVYCPTETTIKAFYYDGSEMWTNKYMSDSALFGCTFEAGYGFNINEEYGIEIKAGYRLQKGALGKLRYSGTLPYPDSRDEIIFYDGYTYDIDASGFFISAGITIYNPEINTGEDNKAGDTKQ